MKRLLRKTAWLAVITATAPMIAVGPAGARVPLTRPLTPDPYFSFEELAGLTADEVRARLILAPASKPNLASEIHVTPQGRIAVLSERDIAGTGGGCTSNGRVLLMADTALPPQFVFTEDRLTELRVRPSAALTGPAGGLVVRCIAVSSGNTGQGIMVAFISIPFVLGAMVNPNAEWRKHERIADALAAVRLGAPLPDTIAALPADRVSTTALPDGSSETVLTLIRHNNAYLDVKATLTVRDGAVVSIARSGSGPPCTRTADWSLRC